MTEGYYSTKLLAEMYGLSEGRIRKIARERGWSAHSVDKDGCAWFRQDDVEAWAKERHDQKNKVSRAAIARRHNALKVKHKDQLAIEGIE